MITDDELHGRSLDRLRSIINNSVRLDLYDEAASNDLLSSETKTFIIVSIDKIDKYIKAIIDHDINIVDKQFLIEAKAGAGYLSLEQCQKLLELRTIMRERGSDIKIYDMELYSLEDVIYANAQMDSVIDKINNARVPDEENRPLTQFEKFMWAYSFVANRHYKESAEDLGRSRNITSILKNNEIVCVGFAMLLQEMCKRLGIECYMNSCDVFTNDNLQPIGHANNVVVLDNQPFACDACLDSITQKNTQVSYNFCLLPVGDFDYTKKCHITNHDAPFQNIERDMKIAKRLLARIQAEDTLTLQQYHSLLCDNMIYINYNKLINIEPEFDYNSLEYIAKYFSSGGSYKEKAESWLKQVIALIEEKKQTTPYSFEDYAEALENIYVSQGVSRSKAKEKVDNILDYTLHRAGEQFTEGAQNGFAIQYYDTMSV